MSGEEHGLEPSREPERAGATRYSLGMLLRHIPLSLWRMRRVVREMQDAGAGWGAFWAISALTIIAVFAETFVRDPGSIRRTADAATTGAISSAEALSMVGWPLLQWAVISLLLVFVWFATARLLRRAVTLRQSIVGVAAGGLPAIVFSLLIALFTLPAYAALGYEAQQRLLEIVDWVIPIALWGYSVVAFAAATRLSLLEALMVQLIGVIGFALLLFGGLSLAGLAGLALDQWISGLVRLVLG